MRAAVKGVIELLLLHHHEVGVHGLGRVSGDVIAFGHCRGGMYHVRVLRGWRGSWFCPVLYLVSVHGRVLLDVVR